MSSVTTAVPSGQINEWCIQNLYSDFDNPVLSTCANASKGTTEADFETICCAGDIVDTTQNLWAWPRPSNRTFIDLSNLVCCLVEGPQTGGIQPINTDYAVCQSGKPTPLASFAATNIHNAAVYEATYTSASFGSDTTGDFIPTQTPTCLWADTASGTKGAALSTVVVPGAQVTTLATTADAFWNPTSTTNVFTDSSYLASWSSRATSKLYTPTASSSTRSSANSNTPPFGAPQILLASAMLCISFRLLRVLV